MTNHYDALETREPAKREAELFASLPDVLRKAMEAPAYAERLKGIDPASVTNPAALARLPVLRKSELPALHKAAPPFGGFVAGPLGSFGRLFTSPGPIFEPEPAHADPWRGARALFAAGFRPGDVVLNTFSYHLTPGGFIFDASARALGCAVIPAGPGNTEAQFELIEAYRPTGYSGTPDFLKILLDKATAPWRIGHGAPAPYELLTGSGNMRLLKASLDVLRKMILELKQFVFIPSAPGERGLLTIGNALLPGEYVILNSLEGVIERIVEKGHYAAEHKENARQFVRDCGPHVMYGLYCASDHSPPYMFYAHRQHVHTAARIAIADSILRPARGFPPRPQATMRPARAARHPWPDA